MKTTTFIAAASAAFLLLGCGSGAPGASAPLPPQAKLVLGYFTGSSDSLASATSSATPVSAVSMDVVTVAADGSLSGVPPASVLSGDLAAGKASYACISNMGSADFDPAIAHGAMVANRDASLRNIVALARTANLTGINIDFEGLYPADRDAYSSFVSDLAAQLHALHSSLILSVPAKTVDSASDDWTWPFDYAAIGKSADLVQVMTYDENVPGRSAGPVAGSDWMLASLQYAASQIPAGKILLGLPAYGYDWNLTMGTGTQVAFKDMPALLATTGAAPQWDATSNSGHISYSALDGSAHQLWYETAQGIQVKAQFAKTLGLAGVSVWALGYEDAGFWNAVAAGIN